MIQALRVTYCMSSIFLFYLNSWKVSLPGEGEHTPQNYELDYGKALTDKISLFEPRMLDKSASQLPATEAFA